MAAFKVAVYVSSQDYLSRLILHLKKSRLLPFDIIGFTSERALSEYIGTGQIDLLLADENITLLHGQLDGKIRRRAFLTESSFNESQNCIGKYQSVRNIASGLLAIYSEMEGEEGPGPRNAEIYGIISLEGAGKKTDFAMQLAQSLKGGGKVLYFEPERFSGLSADEPDPESSLSDVLYLYKTDSPEFKETLGRAVRNTGSADILAQISATEDLAEIGTKEWPDLLLKIMNAGGYSSLLFGITESISSLAEAADFCRAVYICGAENLNTGRKRERLREIEKYFNSLGRDDLLEKVLIVTEKEENGSE